MKKIAVFISSLLLSTSLLAGEIEINDQQIRATPPHAENSAAFFTVTNNTNKDVKLVAVNSDIAERVELHNHISEDGMMKMREVDDINIEANGSVSLQAGGYHVMFLGLKKGLIEGESIRLALYFDNGDEIIMNTPVKKIASSKSKKHNH